MSIFEIRSFLGLAGYYRRIENGLKLSIRGRIIGFCLGTWTPGLGQS